MGLCASKVNTSSPVAAQFDADWIPFIDGKRGADFHRVVRACSPFASHELGERWAEGVLKRMHIGLEKRNLAGVYKYDIKGIGNNGIIEVCCNVTNPSGLPGPHVNRNFHYVLQYLTEQSSDKIDREKGQVMDS